MTDQVYTSPIYFGLRPTSAEERAEQNTEEWKKMHHIVLIYHHCTQTLASIVPELYHFNDSEEPYASAYAKATVYYKEKRYPDTAWRNDDYRLQLPCEKLDTWLLGDRVKDKIERADLHLMFLVQGCKDLCSAASDRLGLPEDIPIIWSDDFPEDHGVEPKHIDGLPPQTPTIYTKEYLAYSREFDPNRKSPTP